MLNKIVCEQMGRGTKKSKPKHLDEQGPRDVVFSQNPGQPRRVKVGFLLSVGLEADQKTTNTTIVGTTAISSTRIPTRWYCTAITISCSDWEGMSGQRQGVVLQ